MHKISQISRALPIVHLPTKKENVRELIPFHIILAKTTSTFSLLVTAFSFMYLMIPSIQFQVPDVFQHAADVQSSSNTSTKNSNTCRIMI